MEDIPRPNFMAFDRSVRPLNLILRLEPVLRGVYTPLGVVVGFGAPTPNHVKRMLGEAGEGKADSWLCEGRRSLRCWCAQFWGRLSHSTKGVRAVAGGEGAM